jgi:hypothetical protein
LPTLTDGQIRILAAPGGGESRNRQIARPWSLRRTNKRQRADRTERDAGVNPIVVELNDPRSGAPRAADPNPLTSLQKVKD